MTTTVARVPFVFVDVFADRALTGNPLALVPDTDNLSLEQMRGVAREFNQSETTFVLRPSRADATWRLRSFTPIGAEVFGAGHNALGAWLWMAESGRLAADRSIFAQEIGEVVSPVSVALGGDGRAVVTMDQSVPHFGAPIDGRAELALGLGLDERDFRWEVPVVVGSTGAEHLLVPVRDRAAVDRVEPDSGRLLRVLRGAGAEGCYVWSPDPVEPSSAAYARFFNPTVGIAEDPATGTAAGPLAAFLVSIGAVADGSEIVIEQGYALGRPSRIRVAVAGMRVRISGSGIVSAEGELLL